MTKSVFIYTYGCQMNVHDSEKMLGLLSDKGFMTAEKPEDADLIIFNTCAIRDKAEQKFFSQLGRTKLLKKKNKNLNIAVAGCVAQETRDGIFRRAPHVDYLIGPQNIDRIYEMVSGRSRSTSFDENLELAVQNYNAKRESKIKAWISIMFGCNNFCSYCIVPYTRGREVSRPSSSILSEALQLKNSGYREVTLLGQNVNSYASDIKFPELLENIDRTGIDRIRFVTSHPRDFSDDLINVMKSSQSVCEHLHLPLQSGSDSILYRMNRGYLFDNYREKVNKLRKILPGIALTTDIIAGFPGETDDDHNKTLQALKEIEFDGIFAFKYSPRKGTKASSMESHVPEELKSERLSEILHLQEEITFKKNKELEGSVQEILIEGSSEADVLMQTGRTRTNKIVNITSGSWKEGDLLNVTINKACMHSLQGVPVETSKKSNV